MEQNGKKAGGGCLRGCLALIIAAVVILFLLYQIDDYLGSSPGEEPQPPQAETAELQETIQKAPQSRDVLTRHYSWEYGDEEWNWNVNIPEWLYEYYRGMPRPPTNDYSVYVTHPQDDAYIGLLIDKLREVSSERGYDDYQTVEFATTFVQSLPYTADSVTTSHDNYPKYPVETLVDNGGDCEDTSILLASLLDGMGYGVVLIGLPDHYAVGVKGGENIHGAYYKYEGDKYYYIETTGTGWGIGQLPDVYEDTSAQIHPMVPVPIITHEWTLEGKGPYAELKVNVSNLGTDEANDMSVFAGFDAGENNAWSGKHSDPFRLGPGQQVTITMILLAPPPNIHTRVVVQIGIEGYRVSESHSEWFDT